MALCQQFEALHRRLDIDVKQDRHHILADTVDLIASAAKRCEYRVKICKALRFHAQFAGTHATIYGYVLVLWRKRSAIRGSPLAVLPIGMQHASSVALP